MSEKNSGISTELALIFATTSGLAIGNLYWAQPLLSVITTDFNLPASQGGFLITATQIGYALGILLLVPLGDITERKKLLSGVMVLTIIALLSCAFANSFEMLSITLFCLGFVTVSGQIIIPLSGDLSTNETRGKIVGIVSAGITIGILFSRLLSGLVADVLSWRSIYLIAAVLNIIITAVLIYRLPKIPAKNKINYLELLSDVFTNFKRYPAMRFILVKSGMVFGIVFNLFWTALTFLLSAEPFNYNTFQIGLVSLAGLTGAVAGAKIGTLQDRGLGNQGMLACIGISIFSMTLAFFSGTSIVLIVLVAALFSLSVQGVGILSQSQLFSFSSTERSRLNTTFVVTNFLFCAVGSSLSSFLWNLGNWQAVTIGAVIASLIALFTHLFQSRKN